MDHRDHGIKFLVAALSISAAATMLAACTSNPETNTSPTPSDGTSVSHTEGSSSDTTATNGSSPSATSTTAPESTEPKARKDVREVAEKFSSLAPPEFFDRFTSCDSNGIPDSHACTGPEVGQFQFFTGDAKAASTTQLLTELRSSRVVDDSGDRIVGWSTLGTTAVITVVDNKRGLTMQQMVSSDKQDPRKRIYELGLATPETSTQPSPSPTANPTSEENSH